MTCFASFQHKIVARAPIYEPVAAGAGPNTVRVPTHYFTLDNCEVWTIISHIIKTTDYTETIKEFARLQDGQGAYKKLKNLLMRRHY